MQSSRVGANDERRPEHAAADPKGRGGEGGGEGQQGEGEGAQRQEHGSTGVSEMAGELAHRLVLVLDPNVTVVRVNAILSDQQWLATDPFVVGEEGTECRASVDVDLW